MADKDLLVGESLIDWEDTEEEAEADLADSDAIGFPGFHRKQEARRHRQMRKRMQTYQPGQRATGKTGRFDYRDEIDE